MRILFLIIFLGCLLNWLFVSVQAKSAMHETTGAVVGLSALVALAVIAILESLEGRAKSAREQAEKERAAAHLHAELLVEITKSAQATARTAEMLYKAVCAAEDARRISADRAQLRLTNLEVLTEQTNRLLEWIGTKDSAAPPSTEG